MQKLFSLRKFVSRATLRYSTTFQQPHPPLLQSLSTRLSLFSSWKHTVGYYVKKHLAAEEAEFQRERRKWRSRFTTNGVLKVLIGTNLAVYLLCKVADEEFMLRNFTIQLDNVKSGAYHTLITSAFSHVDGTHIFSNMLGLLMFGKSIGECAGPKFLLMLYLVGGLSGSVAYLMHRDYLASSYKDTQTEELDPSKAAELDTQTVERDPSKTPALGASGAVTAIVFLDILLFPNQILLVDLMPLPAAAAGICMVWEDIERVMKDDRVAGSAHLGGAVVGALAWALLRRRL